jgi:ferredoxin
MKVTVDWDLCDGNGMCAVEAPTVFELDDDDELHVLTEDIDEAARLQVESAVRFCPKQALGLTP